MLLQLNIVHIYFLERQANKIIYYRGNYMDDFIRELDCIKAPDCECVKNAYVYGLCNSIRGAKFPMSVDTDKLNSEITSGIMRLAQCEKGTGHDQWLTGVVVQFDLTFSNKAWVEMERYTFMNFVSSQSTMHRITKFNIDENCNEYVDPRVKEVVNELVEQYNNTDDDDLKRELYLKILYNNPAGFRLTARMTTNYRQLKTIYAQRRTHRLPEWRQFCGWIETLPYSDMITGENK